MFYILSDLSMAILLYYTPIDIKVKISKSFFEVKLKKLANKINNINVHFAKSRQCFKHKQQTIITLSKYQSR